MLIYSDLSFISLISEKIFSFYYRINYSYLMTSIQKDSTERNKKMSTVAYFPCSSPGEKIKVEFLLGNAYRR